MIELSNGSLSLVLHEPTDGFYRGTRFDRSGVFDSVRFHGTELADRWFTVYDPYKHDTVCGPAEEFTVIGFDQAALRGHFLKIGVGLLLRPDSEPYDRFRLYETADPGEWSVEASGAGVRFRHRLEGCYEYEKEVVLTGPDSFEIRHSLRSLGVPLSGEVYNHNFWTMGRLEVGPSRQLAFPFWPCGHWRSEYDSVALTASGLRFSRRLAEGESVFMGDLHAADSDGMPLDATLREGSLGVHISGDAPVSHSVFWANHRVACLEPYIPFAAPSSWTLRWQFESE